MTSDFHHFYCHVAEFIIFKCQEQQKFPSMKMKSGKLFKFKDMKQCFLREIDDKIDMRKYLGNLRQSTKFLLSVKRIKVFRKKHLPTDNKVFVQLDCEVGGVLKWK